MRQLYHYYKYGLGLIFFNVLLWVKKPIMIYKCSANGLKSFNIQYLALKTSVYECEKLILKEFSG